MGLRTLRTRFLKGGAEPHPPQVIPVIPEPGADRVKGSYSNKYQNVIENIFNLMETFFWQMFNPISPGLWKYGNYPGGGPQHHPLENGFGASGDP